MMRCACNTASKAGQGVSYRLWKLFEAVIPTGATFFPHEWGGGAQSKLTMPAQRTQNITNQHRNRHDNYNIRPRKRLLQRQETNGEQADHEAAKTTVHGQNDCSSQNVTRNGPHAGRQTPN